jgi:2-keto-4-pentenoate hydratase/2-oxohepta-3-ene-1,7-dioic acid hydratase in catechol pathway
LKAWSSLAYNPKQLSLEIANTHRIDHELELGVFIKKGGVNIPIKDAMSHVGGYFIGIDLTDRGIKILIKICKVQQKQKGFHGHSQKDKIIFAQFLSLLNNK